MPKPPIQRRRGRHSAKPQGPSLPKDPMEVTIFGIGAKGDGLGKDDSGHGYYVPYAAEGDVLKVRITGKRENDYVGDISEIITPGEHRIEAPCPYYTKCGGCNLQHIDKEAYAHWKSHKVADSLKRSQISINLDKPVLVGPHCRRRASFAVMKKGKKILFGFNAKGSHRIEEIDHCLLLSDPLNALIDALRNLMPLIMKREGRGDIIVNYPGEAADIVLALPGPMELKAHQHLVTFAEKHNIGRLSWQQDGKGTPETIIQRCAVTTQFGDALIELPTSPFLQPSKEGEIALVEFALSALRNEKKILDLYAGCGSFTFALAKVGIVHAVESHAPALKALELSAGRAGLGGRITTEVRDLDRQPLMGKELSKFDAILFDPPRAGAREQARFLAESDVPVIIAISCNPATFGRDAVALIEGGYTLERVMPVDQFTWSDHVEVAAIFRKDPK